MVTLRTLLGSRSEVHYECMYTKHKTQKRKVWHDGFLALYSSRRLVLHEDEPPEGKVLDEAKMSVYDWDRKDEDYINVTKFLIEVVNETPLGSIQRGGGAGASSNGATSAYEPMSMEAEPMHRAEQHTNTASASTMPPRSMNARFKVPVSHGSAAPPRLTRPGVRQQTFGGRSAAPMKNTNVFDFDRNPTSEWNYEPNAINRSGNVHGKLIYSRLLWKTASMRHKNARRNHCDLLHPTHNAHDRKLPFTPDRPESLLPLPAVKRYGLPRILRFPQRLGVQCMVVLRDLDLAVSFPSLEELVQSAQQHTQQHQDDAREHIDHDLRCLRHGALVAWGERERHRTQRERARRDRGRRVHRSRECLLLLLL